MGGASSLVVKERGGWGVDFFLILAGRRTFWCFAPQPQHRPHPPTIPQWSNLSMTLRGATYPVIRMHFHPTAKPGGDAPTASAS